MNIFETIFNVAIKQNIEILRLRRQLEEYGIKETDYSFIPSSWVPITTQELITLKKYEQAGIIIPTALTDLLDSSYLTRDRATRFVSASSYLDVINAYIEAIKYVENQIQFGKADLWLNGDTALATSKGDCDLSVRATIRVLKDTIYQNRWNINPAHLFQAYGFYLRPDGKSFGHSWLLYWDSGEKKFKIYEMTRDTRYNKGESEDEARYELYFCHNNRRGWYQNADWKTFI